MRRVGRSVVRCKRTRKYTPNTQRSSFSFNSNRLIHNTRPLYYSEQKTQSPTENDNEQPKLTVEQLQAELDKVQARNTELISAVANYDNLRKRAEELKMKEVKDAKDFGITNFAKSLLEVADNLERAQNAVPKDLGNNPVMKSFIEGVDMTQKGLMRAFEKNGLKRIDPMNEKFDPAFHQALFQVEDDSKPANTVCIVQQVGYTLQGRNLRSAMVGVSKKSPKPQEPKEEDK
eukprot:TRINITY_DN1355_c1_g1_i1.p1 TRINITY_DN1355_c1_g1~~TRINITY_DN1355_c1_g1_i1.p1  ORF type:complete len:232 (-),score=51.17 TRINITY_DN1355_c1_g1_i1:124-819(-)